jgi:hypothetical protein
MAGIGLVPVLLLYLAGVRSAGALIDSGALSLFATALTAQLYLRVVRNTSTQLARWQWYALQGSVIGGVMLPHLLGRHHGRIDQIVCLAVGGSLASAYLAGYLIEIRRTSASLSAPTIGGINR